MKKKMSLVWQGREVKYSGQRRRALLRTKGEMEVIVSERDRK